MRAWHCARHLEGRSPPLGSRRGLPRDPRAPRGPTASPRRPSPPRSPHSPRQAPLWRPEPTARPRRRPQQAPAAPRPRLERERSCLRWLPHPSLPFPSGAGTPLRVQTQRLGARGARVRRGRRDGGEWAPRGRQSAFLCHLYWRLLCAKRWAFCVVIVNQNKLMTLVPLLFIVLPLRKPSLKVRKGVCPRLTVREELGFKPSSPSPLPSPRTLSHRARPFPPRCVQVRGVGGVCGRWAGGSGGQGTGQRCREKRYVMFAAQWPPPLSEGTKNSEMTQHLFLPGVFSPRSQRLCLRYFPSKE